LQSRDNGCGRRPWASQFAEGSFDGRALVHAFFELPTLLVSSPLLEKIVILAHHDRPTRLSSWDSSLSAADNRRSDNSIQSDN
jgi:hypothetical protein